MSAVLACSLYIHEFPDHCHSLVFLVVILGRACTPRQNFLSLHHSAGRHSEGGRTGAEGLNPAVGSIDDEDSSSPPPAEETNRKFLFYPMPMGRPSRAALSHSPPVSRRPQWRPCRGDLTRVERAIECVTYPSSFPLPSFLFHRKGSANFYYSSSISLSPSSLRRALAKRERKRGKGRGKRFVRSDEKGREKEKVTARFQENHYEDSSLPLSSAPCPPLRGEDARQVSSAGRRRRRKTGRAA